MSSIFYRDVCLTDFDALKTLHVDLFPVDYDDSWFRSVVTRSDGIFTYLAVESSRPLPTVLEPGQQEQHRLVGFVTARWMDSKSIDQTDRRHLEQQGLGSCSYDLTCCYILTLGIHPAYRGRGLARGLLNLVKTRAEEANCPLIYLHVLTSNASAIKLYASSGYECLALLRDFYLINTGRQPDITQTRYDALILSYRLSVNSNLTSIPHSKAYQGREYCLPHTSILFNSCFDPRARTASTPKPSSILQSLFRWMP